MRDLDVALPDRQQPSVGQDGQGLAHGLVRLGVELGERDAPAHDRLVVAPGQPQEDRPRDPLPVLVEACECRLGQARHRARHAAGLRVACAAHGPPVAPVPQLNERGR